MERAPSIEAITEWLSSRRPLGISEPITVQDIDLKPWSGHFNFLVTTPERKFVLRFKGPEWGSPSQVLPDKTWEGKPQQGIIDEYENLKAVESFAVGPRVLGLERGFFGEPAMFMEYLEGRPLSVFTSEEQLNFYPEVVQLILKINQIPHQQLNLRLAEPYTSYARHKETWRERLAVIQFCSPLAKWAGRLRELLPRAEAMLDRFEPRLQRVLSASGPAFLFVSSHIGHCFVTPAGLRFINWEEVCIGDPSFTFAVFLASIITRSDFPTVKEDLVQRYLAEHPIPEFRELVGERLAEREVSNLFWVLWAYAARKDTKPPEEVTGAPGRYERSIRMLERFSS